METYLKNMNVNIFNVQVKRRHKKLNQQDSTDFK